MKINIAQWPAPPHIHAYMTTRQGGYSINPYASLNTAIHVGDDAVSVNKNRALLKERLHLPTDPVWLNQVHGCQVIEADKIPLSEIPTADAAFTTQPNIVCAVQTADCLPLLLCDREGTAVAAVHAGWRGLCAGVIEATLQKFSAKTADIFAWMGAAIGPQAFVVGEDVRAAFMAVSPVAAQAFVPHFEAGRWFADIYTLARQRLQAFGVTHIFGGGECTFSQPEYYYSYRRDHQTGRMASLVWITSS